jgi:hypothetical protein
MTTTVPDQQLLAANPNLTQADITSYNVKKKQLFKFTIATCIIYGIITLLIFVLTILNPKINQLFSVDVRPFTMTFVGGMIFVIIILIYQVYTFKPVALTVSSYDKDICPDFWKLVPTLTSSDPSYSNAGSNIQGLLQYQCVPDSNVWQTYRTSTTTGSGPSLINFNAYGQSNYATGLHGLNTIHTTINTHGYVGVFGNSITNTNALDGLVGPNGLNGTLTSLNPALGASNLRCDQVFPTYLANANAAASANDSTLPTNAYACAYSQACGIPWTGVCGN